MKTYKITLITYINNINQTIIADEVKVTCDGTYNFMVNKNIVASFPVRCTAITEVLNFNEKDFE